LSDGEPTPAIPPSSIPSVAGDPTRAIRQSEFQSEAPPPADTSAIPSVMKRPSVADRLQQVRESGSRPSSGKPRGTAILGPVTSDPTTSRPPRLAEQPSNPALPANGESNSEETGLQN
jgi:hypothetical protein